MNLVASLIVRDELSRYLLDSIELLLGFCDEVRVYDDASTDGTVEALTGMDRVKVASSFGPTFYTNEGAARQRALDFTMEANPTHILAIDGDELISDGQRLRRQIEHNPQARTFTLCMEEIWQADRDTLYVRQDGGWKAHPVAIVYAAGGDMTIPQKALASGRVPVHVGRDRRMLFTGVSVYHFGWARIAERVARHARYVKHDGGNFHASAHLDSIMWPDSRVHLDACPWPDGIPRSVRDSVVAKANRP